MFLGARLNIRVCNEIQGCLILTIRAQNKPIFLLHRRVCLAFVEIQ